MTAAETKTDPVLVRGDRLKVGVVAAIGAGVRGAERVVVRANAVHVRTDNDIAQRATQTRRHRRRPAIIQRLDVIALIAEHRRLVGIIERRVDRTAVPARAGRQIRIIGFLVVGKAIARIHAEAVKIAARDEIDHSAPPVCAVKR